MYKSNIMFYTHSITTVIINFNKCFLIASQPFPFHTSAINSQIYSTFLYAGVGHPPCRSVSQFKQLCPRLTHLYDSNLKYYLPQTNPRVLCVINKHTTTHIHTHTHVCWHQNPFRMYHQFTALAPMLRCFAVVHNCWANRQLANKQAKTREKHIYIWLRRPFVCMISWYGKTDEMNKACWAGRVFGLHSNVHWIRI